MIWLAVIAVVLALVAFVAAGRAQPDGTRPVGSTRLMAVGRWVLAIAAVVLVLFAAAGRLG